MEEQRKYNARVRTRWNRIDHETEITICYLDYIGQTYPQNQNLEFILDTIYSFSDISTLPIVNNLTKNISNRTEFNRYLSFVNESIEVLQSINNKPIIGMVPRIAYGYISDLIDNYIDNDITHFTFDLDRRNVVALTQSYLAAYRRFREHDLMETSLINAINSTPGRFLRNENVVSAKDVLSYGFGFDTIGKCHRGPRMPAQAWKNMNRSENKVRLFNKEDYGYHKIVQADLSTIFPSDSEITMSQVTQGNSAKRYENLLNIEQIGLESMNLQTIIREEPTIDYLERKDQITRSDLSRMTSFKNQVNMRTINELFK